jgi:putative NADH-flavin reductase
MRHIASQPLRIAVLGASGATGGLVSAAGLARGHRIVALTRRAGTVAPAAGLSEAVWPDVSDGGALRDALTGVDVVISALGGAPTGPTSVCTDAIRSVVPAMAAAGVSRLIVVSAHGVLESHDGSLYVRAAWAGVGEKLKDKETMEPLITESALDWTIVRPPALTNSRASGKYRVGGRLPIRLWHSVGRADLAAFLIGEAEDGANVRRTVRIHG